MKYSYDIELGINNDIWNWYDASQHSSHGFDWRNNIDNEEDKQIFNQISKLRKKDAHIILEKYLKEKYLGQVEIITEYINNIKLEFDKKFNLACSALEKITNKKLFITKYIFNLTTFPRCPYDPETGEIFFYITLDKFWPDPIENFLHEVLHFQFLHFWQDNPKSPVSKLSYDDFEFLKESLTVVLDDELKPLINNSDTGYPIHQEFRKELHKNWIIHHDFNKLVDFGLMILKDYQGR